MTARDIEKSFTLSKNSWNYKLRALSYSFVDISYLIHAIFFKVWALEQVQTAKVTFDVTQCHGHWCHSIGHIRFPISLPFHLCLYLAPFPRHYWLFTENKKRYETLNASPISGASASTVSQCGIVCRLLCATAVSHWTRSRGSWRLICHHSVHSITPSLFHSRLKTYLYHKSYPRSFTSSSRTASTDLCLDPFFWATRFLILVFSYFFVTGPWARLSWPSRQLLCAR